MLISSGVIYIISFTFIYILNKSKQHLLQHWQPSQDRREYKTKRNPECCTVEKCHNQRCDRDVCVASSTPYIVYKFNRGLAIVRVSENGCWCNPYATQYLFEKVMC